MSSSSQVAESWISSFCSLLGHEYFAEVSEDFIEDDFNLTGLQSQVPMYKEALEMILDVEPEDDEEDEDEEDEDEDEDDMLGDGERPAGYRRAGDRRHMRMASDLSMVESSAELLYGLIHQRYITSRPGIQQMLEKYDMQHFGLCPRVNCDSAKVLPVGCSDTPGQETVKLFCPSCLDVYTPPNSRFQSVDGAFFGTTFGCLFFMTFPELDIGTSRASAATDQILAPSPGASSSANATPTVGSSSQTNGARISVRQTSIINGVVPHNLAPGLGSGRIYEPRIYGFRVAERARSGPRMKWLRDKPNDITLLDETRRYWEQFDGEDGIDEEDDDGTEMEDDAVRADEGAEVMDVERPDGLAGRKKARRRQNGNSAVSPMDTNGLGDVG